MHALVGGSMAAAHPWGAARLDAMQLIFNELAGLAVGAPPSFIPAGSSAPSRARRRPAGRSTTGCEARGFGVSRCGHECGTRLPAADKKALLKYLTTL